MINMADVVSDKDFTQNVKLIRRVTTVNDHGETVTTERITTIKAVVTSAALMAAANNLIRDPDSTKRAYGIRVTTTTTLNSAYEAGQPDIIIWQGNRYVVGEVDFHQAYGFCRAVAILMDTQLVKQK